MWMHCSRPRPSKGKFIKMLDFQLYRHKKATTGLQITTRCNVIVYVYNSELIINACQNPKWSQKVAAKIKNNKKATSSLEACDRKFHPIRPIKINHLTLIRSSLRCEKDLSAAPRRSDSSPTPPDNPPPPSGSISPHLAHGQNFVTTK